MLRFGNSRSGTPARRRKSVENQSVTRRNPRQARSLHKVELILEAAMQLLESAGLEKLTTNAVAAKAGVSIGTLYQYFGSKQALLDALVTRELSAMSAKVVASLRMDAPASPGDRIRRIVRAVNATYGGRNRVHRLLIEHASATQSAGRLMPLFAELIDLWTNEGIAAPGDGRRRLSHADAFVMVHSIAGVLRTLAASKDAPPAAEVEDALVRMIVGFVSGSEGRRRAPTA
ncbi:TetR/AcrR family transcriptional regulator [Burkholderia dolosa]|uniref:TetR/AcrR family transcriptional regulator n=1 Tax=Burkholderia dolosa TaxID=152500 RepID=UPI0024AEF704|nr:TetR/AcrR family transcriptional regulator [Burkholderia dolosa]MDN7422701.1 TetR/AcrR family transcriptional regulator [Burkholderia dolosa]